MSINAPLSAKELVIGYKGKKSIEIAGPLNFSIYKSQLYGLIGINGIGKSTIIKTLSGLLPPLQGKVLINNKNIIELKDQERARLISLVLTDKINSGFATVKEIVKMGRYPYTNWQFGISKTDTEIINQAIESVNLHDKRNSLFSELSDGNKQKVMIAKALAQDTPVLILDEPTVHLDIKNRFMLLELLQHLSKTHDKTILFSGHDLEYMFKFCDQIMLMTPNKLTIDNPTDIMNNGLITEAFGLEVLPSLFKKSSLYTQ